MNTDAELLGQQNAASTTCTATDSQEGQAVSLYLHVQTLSKMTYEAELRREDSLIQQSSHMQTAFSFMTAALFMSAPILIENRGETLLLPWHSVVSLKKHL